ncbi:MAG: ferritin-like domain-containing protein [Planctomycetota bacterium]|jgi:rubrerythrin
MSELFEVAEVVKVAVEDEKSGVAFYSVLAERAASDELKKTFAELAEQEKFHQKRFEEMLEGLGAHKPGERYPGEYAAYLRALTDDRAFPDEGTAREKAHQCPDDASALELAIRFERDTLLLMNEMRAMVPEKDAAVVRELAQEEQSHLVVLANARQKI